MSKRIRRKSISNTFKIKGRVCKVILKPLSELDNGFWVWNVGFAVGKSNRQINDWYNKRNNKRARSLHNKFTNDIGLRAIAQGWRRVLKLRWSIEPGDSIILDCRSGKPEQQFKVYQYWKRYHCDWLYDKEKLEFYWTRPPYPDDTIWKKGEIIGVTPKKPLEPIHPGAYFDCFTFLPYDN
jgi:hypothetical protein